MTLLFLTLAMIGHCWPLSAEATFLLGPMHLKWNDINTWIQLLMDCLHTLSEIYQKLSYRCKGHHWTVQVNNFGRNMRWRLNITDPASGTNLLLWQPAILKPGMQRRWLLPFIRCQKTVNSSLKSRFCCCLCYFAKPVQRLTTMFPAHTTVPLSSTEPV